MERMRTLGPSTALLVAMTVGAGCATHVGTQGVQPMDVNADKVFAVIISGTPGRCTAAVIPKKGDGVKVEPGWRVAWVVYNECDDQDRVLKINPEFTYGGERKTPVKFAPFQNGVLAGKVRSSSVFGRKCRKDDPTHDLPCGTYIYDAMVGDIEVDPDFEIIEP